MKHNEINYKEAIKLEELKFILKSSMTVKIKFRTIYNFLEWGICLSKEVQSEQDNNLTRYYVLIGNLQNKVYLEDIIEVRDAWFA